MNLNKLTWLGVVVIALLVATGALLAGGDFAVASAGFLGTVIVLAVCVPCGKFVFRRGLRHPVSIFLLVVAAAGVLTAGLLVGSAQRFTAPATSTPPGPTPTQAVWEQVELVIQSDPEEAARLFVRVVFEDDARWRTPLKDAEEDVAGRLAVVEPASDQLISQVGDCLASRGVTVTYAVQDPLNLLLHIGNAEAFTREYPAGSVVIEDQGPVDCGLTGWYVQQWYVGEHVLHDGGTEKWTGGWVFVVLRHEQDRVLLDAYKVQALLLAEDQGP